MDIESARDKYSGERIFVIGNGPSLDETPLELLNEEYSVGTNMIDNIYNKTGWRPSFYYFIHKDLPENKRQSVYTHLDLGIPCFIKQDHQAEFKGYNNAIFIDKISMQSDIYIDSLSCPEIRDVESDQLLGYWSEEPHTVYSYHSMFGIFQICNYLGFDEIYLLGCDLGLSDYSPHMIFDQGLDPRDYGDRDSLFGAEISYLRDGLSEGKMIVSLANGITFKLLQSPLSNLTRSHLVSLFSIEDTNHFGSRYSTRAKDLSRDEHQIVKSHEIAKIIAEERGFDIYNATLGGDLDVYPRVDLEEKV